MSADQIPSKATDRNCEMHSKVKEDLDSLKRKNYFPCKICSKVFSYNRNLNVHLRIHSKEKPYVCEICSKRFSQSAHLKTHLGIHTNERPYVCEICSKAFSLKGSLNLHYRTHTK